MSHPSRCAPTPLVPLRHGLREHLAVLAVAVVMPLLGLALTSMLYVHLLQVEQHLPRISEQLAQTLPR